MTRFRGRLFSGFAVAALASGVAVPALAGFVPPSAWQAPVVQPSVEILAHRAALTGGVGAAVADSDMLTMQESWALSIFYQSRDFALAWIGPTGPTTQALDIVRVLKDAGSHALDASQYADAVQAAAELAKDATLRERVNADVLLSRAALLYARHASAGRVDPKSLSRNIDFAPLAAEPADVLERLLAADGPGDYLESLNPRTADYRALRSAFEKLLAGAALQKLTRVPEGPLLKPGVSGSRVALLRERLNETGDLASGAPSDPSVFDETLEAAVETFQARESLPVDGVVGSMTLAALNRSPADQLRQLAVNMERRRWMPDDFGTRHVLVNEPAFALRVVDAGETVHTARVVIGKSYHQSPAFSDEIETVVFNPYWNVPDSIAYKEYLPLLRRDPTYLARQGFRMYAASGSRFVPAEFSAVDWSHPDAGRFRFKLRQPPGAANALGKVKFLFPNKHSVYLHDTPSKSLFARDSRAFSHGCIRVQDPLKLAEVLLEREGWSRADIDRAVASGRNQHIALDTHVPVHLVYWTAAAQDNGTVVYHRDVYDRDERLASALGFDAAALKMAQLTDY